MMAAMLKLGAPAPAPSTPPVANDGGTGTDDGNSFAAELEAQQAPSQNTDANAAQAERASGDQQQASDGKDDDASDQRAPDESALNDVLAALALLPGSPFAQATPAAQTAAAADAAALPVLPGMATKALAALAGAPAPGAEAAAAPALQTQAPLDAAQPAAGIALAGAALQPAAADDAALPAELAALQGDGAAGGDLLGEGGGSEGGLEFRLPEAATTTRPAAAKSTPVDVPLTFAQQRDGEFAEGVASRVQWMTETKIGRAELRLNPADLGAIDVNLQIEGKQVRAEFSSANADVRQLLESGIPKLREMFSQQGLQLAHSHVGQQQSQAQQQSGNSGGGSYADRHGGDATQGEIVDAPVRVRVPTGLVDAFA